MSTGRLVRLYLDGIPGVGSQDIRVAVQVEALAGPIPEVNVQSLPSRVIVDEPALVIAGILREGDRRSSHTRRKVEVKTGIVQGGRNSAIESRRDRDILPGGVS